MFELIKIAQAAEAAAEASTQTAQQTSVLSTLGLNGSMFIAQLFNFAIILFVLWKWVLPIVGKKLTERTEKIENSLKDADRIEKEKQEFQIWRDQEMSKTRNEASFILTQAQIEAQNLKDDMMKKTKDDQQKAIEDARIKIESEKNNAIREVKTEMADLVTLATEKILKKKLDAKLDKQMVTDTLKSM